MDFHTKHIEHYHMKVLNFKGTPNMSTLSYQSGSTSLISKRVISYVMIALRYIKVAPSMQLRD